MLLAATPGTAELDTVKPYVVDFSPADGQGGVKIDTVISIEFSEEIRAENLDSQITLKDGRGFIVAKRVDYSNLTHRAIITPIEPLKYSMLYFVSVSALIHDLAGNPLRQPIQWSFNTTREKVPPVVVSTVPVDGAKDVSINATISVQFSEEMDLDSLQTGLVVRDSLDNPVIGNTTPAANGMKVSFEALFSFGYGEVYTVTVLKTVKDLAGNTMGQDHEFSFAVQLEKIPPRVTEFTPQDQDRSVNINTKISIEFSEPMNSTSLAWAAILQDPDLEEVPVTPQYNSDNYTLIIRPDQPLDYQTIYTVTVRTTAMDLAGNQLDREYYTTFTTEPLPQQPPQITERIPPEDRFNWYEGIAAKFEVEADDPNGDILVYTWYVNGEEKEGETFNTFNFYPEPGSEGSYKIEVEVYDGTSAPVDHYWIVDVLATGDGNGNGDGQGDLDFDWGLMILLVIIIIVVAIVAAGYLTLMDRRSQILAKTRRRLRPLSLRRDVKPKEPPSYEEMYLRADGVYAEKSPEFKPIKAPGGGVTRTRAGREAAVEGVVMGEAPQLLEAKEVEVRRADVGPATTAAPELKRKGPPGTLVCPKCGGKAIEAAHGRIWCDECGYIE